MADNTTVVIPFGVNGNREWLRQAVQSLPQDILDVGRYLIVENDGEFAQAMNTGLEAAETDFVFFLGADDKLAPGALDLLEAAASDADVVYPSRLLYGPDMGSPKSEIRAQPFCPNRLLVWNYIPGTALVRRQAALDAGGFRELPFDTHEDYDLWVRMMRAGYRFKNCPEAVLRIRQHRGSKSSRARDDQDGVLHAEIYRTVVGEPPRFPASFYYQNSFATTYLRCLLPARYLPAACFEYPAVVNFEDGIGFPQHQGVGVFQFPGDAARGLVMQRMKDLGHPVLAEVDDNYLAGSHGFKTGWVKDIADMSKDEPHSFEAHRRIVTDIADGVIVTTEALAKAYRKANPNVYVCPNQVDPADWRDPVVSRAKVRELLGIDPDAFVVGWFGSAYHVLDQKLVRRALEWASRQDGVEVLLMGVWAGVDQSRPGVVERNWDFPRKQIGWSNDLPVYFEAMSALDVGLAPIVGSYWARGKSDVKALEYSMAGALPIVSDQPPYEMLTEGENCLKARDARGFFEQVRWAIQHRDEAKDLAARCREYVLRDRTAAGNVWRYLEAFEDVRKRVGTA